MFNEYCETLQSMGFDPIPLAPGCKHPRIKEWQSRKFFPEPRYARYGIGHRTGIIGAIDVDILDEGISDLVWSILSNDFDITTKRVGKPPKWAALVWNNYGTKLCQSFGEHKIEFLGEGQQLAFYHIHPDTGKPYEWVHSDPIITDDLVLPVIGIDDAHRIIDTITRLTKLEPSGVYKRGSKPGVFREWEDNRATHIKSNPIRREKDAVLGMLYEKGLVIKDKENGKYELECPWGEEHVSGIRTGAVYYAPAGIYMPKFICLHETCRSNNRRYEELVEWLKS